MGISARTQRAGAEKDGYLTKRTSHVVETKNTLRVVSRCTVQERNVTMPCFYLQPEQDDYNKIPKWEENGDKPNI